VEGEGLPLGFHTETLGVLWGEGDESGVGVEVGPLPSQLTVEKVV